MLRKLSVVLSVVTLCQSALLAGTITTYPSTWDVTHRGEPLPDAARSGTPVFHEKFKTLSIGADGAQGVTWYAPIHSQLGVGKMAKPTDREAISVDQSGLLLQTRDPGEPTGVDVNVQTMDKEGHGFAMQNGYFEVKASLPVAHGNHAGIWLLSQPDDQGHGEIDIVESYGAVDRNIHSSLHFWPIVKNSRFAKHVFIGKGFFKPDDGFEGEFHDFGVLLTPKDVIYYFDQKETRRGARLPEQEVPFYLLLSNFTDAKRKDGYEPATMRVASVQAWQTSDLTQGGESEKAQPAARAETSTSGENNK